MKSKDWEEIWSGELLGRNRNGKNPISTRQKPPPRDERKTDSDD